MRMTLHLKQALIIRVETILSGVVDELRGLGVRFSNLV